MSFSRTKAALHLCSLFSPLLFFSISLGAPQVSLEPQVGFHGWFQLGYPFPLRIEIDNRGGPVEGNLEVMIWKGGPTRGVNTYPVFHRKGVFLSAQSRKSFQFTVDPDSVSRPLTVTFSGTGFRHSKEVDLRRHFSPSPLILLVSANNFALPLPLNSASGPLISLSIGQLPSDPRAYHGVSTLIFYEQSLRDLSRRQAAALEGWLSSGGRMLVLGGLHYALYQEPSMSRFLPVRVAGLKRFSSVPNLESRYGKRVALLRDLWGQDSRLLEGRVLLEEQGIPILVETGRGRGRILYLALDIGRPPLSRWAGLSDLFRDLLGTQADRRPTLQASWDDSVFSQLLSNPFFISAYVPVRSFFLWILFYLGGVAVLAWRWRQQRLRWRAVLVCFLTVNIISSVGGYLYFSRRGNVPDGVLLSATLMESLPDGYAEAQSNVALFSTQTREYGLQVESDWSDLEAFHPRPGTPKDAAVIVQDEGSSTRFIFPLREWAYRLFKVRSLRPFPVRTEIESHGDRLSFRLSNLSPRDLNECWFVVQGQAFFLGDIPRGSSQVREFPLATKGSASSVGQPKYWDLREVRFANSMRDLLFRYSFFTESQGGARWGKDSALFFGWVKEAPPRIWADDARVLAYDYTLFRAILRFDEDREL